jgi:hypothetical protein
VRADARLGNVDDIEAEVRARLAEAGIEVSEGELAAIRTTLGSDWM